MDTNAIIYAIQNKINLEDFIEEEIGIPTSVIRELRGLSSSNTDARVALNLAARYKEVPVTSSGDIGIEEAAKKTGSKVLTNDVELKKRLSSDGITAWAVGKNGIKK